MLTSSGGSWWAAVTRRNTAAQHRFIYHGLNSPQIPSVFSSLLRLNFSFTASYFGQFMQLNISDKQERYLLLLSSAVLFILHCTGFFISFCMPTRLTWFKKVRNWMDKCIIRHFKERNTLAVWARCMTPFQNVRFSALWKSAWKNCLGILEKCVSK